MGTFGRGGYGERAPCDDDEPAEDPRVLEEAVLPLLFLLPFELVLGFDFGPTDARDDVVRGGGVGGLTSGRGCFLCSESNHFLTVVLMDCRSFVFDTPRMHLPLRNRTASSTWQPRTRAKSGAARPRSVRVTFANRIKYASSCDRPTCSSRTCFDDGGSDDACDDDARFGPVGATRGVFFHRSTRPFACFDFGEPDGLFLDRVSGTGNTNISGFLRFRLGLVAAMLALNALARRHAVRRAAR